MLKQYEEMQLQVVVFLQQDVVRTSGVEKDIYGPGTDTDVWE